MWEDNNMVDNGGSRSLNHFYDPISKQGLTVPVFGHLGIPSETWGTIRNVENHPAISAIAGGVGGTNEYAWQNARAYQEGSIYPRINNSTCLSERIMFCGQYAPCFCQRQSANRAVTAPTP